MPRKQPAGGKGRGTDLDGHLGVLLDFEDDVHRQHPVHHVLQGVGYAQTHQASADLLLCVPGKAIQVQLQCQAVWVNLMLCAVLANSAAT